MSKLKELHSMLLDLYEAKQYEEVIKKVNRFLQMDIKNYKYIRSSKFLRAKSFRYLNRFEEAISELKELYSLEEKNSYFSIELFYTYYYVGKYREAYEMLPNLYSIENKNISNHSLSIMELVIRRNLSLPMYEADNKKSEYLMNQIMYYDEKLALNHIASHKHFEESTHNVHSLFKENINLAYLMREVKKNLNDNNKVNRKDVLETYYFAIPGIGFDENNMCNYLKVVVCPGTKDIITMYPFAYVEIDNIPLLNCDLDILFNRDKKEKTNSRIDKFNKRFNLK